MLSKIKSVTFGGLGSAKPPRLPDKISPLTLQVMGGAEIEPSVENFIQYEHYVSEIGEPVMMKTASGVLPVFMFGDDVLAFTDKVNLEEYRFPPEWEHFQIGQEFSLPIAESSQILTPVVNEIYAPKIFNQYNIFDYSRQNVIFALHTRPSIGQAQKIKVTISPPGDNTSGIQRKGVMYDVADNSVVYFYVPWMSHEWMNHGQPFVNIHVDKITDLVSRTDAPEPLIFRAEYQFTECILRVHRRLTAAAPPLPGALTVGTRTVLSAGSDVIPGTVLGEFSVTDPCSMSLANFSSNAPNGIYTIQVGSNNFTVLGLTNLSVFINSVNAPTNTSTQVQCALLGPSLLTYPVSGLAVAGNILALKMPPATGLTLTNLDIIRKGTVVDLTYDSVNNATIATYGGNSYALLMGVTSETAQTYIYAYYRTTKPYDPWTTAFAGWFDTDVANGTNAPVLFTTGTYVVTYLSSTGSTLNNANPVSIGFTASGAPPTFTSALARSRGVRKLDPIIKNMSKPEKFALGLQLLRKDHPTADYSYFKSHVDREQNEVNPKDYVVIQGRKYYYQSANAPSEVDFAAASPQVPVVTEKLNTPATMGGSPMIATVGEISASMSVVSMDFIPIVTVPVEPTGFELNHVIHPGNWRGAVESQAQAIIRNHVFSGPVDCSYATYKVTDSATAFQNGRFIIAHIPPSFSATEVSALTAQDLKQFPNKEHKIHGTETIIQPGWVLPVPVLYNHRVGHLTGDVTTVNPNFNGYLVIRILENSFSTDTPPPQLTLWVCARNVKVSMPRQPATPAQTPFP